VHGVRLEAHAADRAYSARSVLAFKIALQYELIVSQHDHAMQIPDEAISDSFVKAPSEISSEARSPRRDRQPLLRHGDQPPWPMDHGSRPRGQHYFATACFLYLHLTICI
jgi:hypothetical protein